MIAVVEGGKEEGGIEEGLVLKSTRNNLWLLCYGCYWCHWRHHLVGPLIGSEKVRM